MNVNLTLATRYGLNALGLLGVSAALYLGASIFIPLTISVLLAAMLYPAALWCHKTLKFPWFASCLCVITMLVLVCLSFFTAIVASIPSLVNKLPSTEEEWQQKYEQAARQVREISPFPTDEALPEKAGNSKFYKSVKEFFDEKNIAPILSSLAMKGLSNVGETVLILFVVLFLMLEGELLAKKVRGIFGTSRESNRRVTEAIAQMADSIRTYLLWRTLINIGLGLVVGLVYYFLGLDQWYLWAVMTVILNYVPYIGTIAAGVPPVLEALIGGKTDAALIIVLGYTVLVTVEGYWIVPKVMGKSMDLNATTVMVACLYWNLVWGVAGLFLAMPLMAAIKAILLNVEGYRPWGDLLSSVDTTPASPPHDEAERIEALAREAIADGDADATVIMDDPPPPR